MSDISRSCVIVLLGIVSWPCFTFLCFRTPIWILSCADGHALYVLFAYFNHASSLQEVGGGTVRKGRIMCIGSQEAPDETTAPPRGKTV
eukprot:3782495-Amphidinium_carterae.1